MRFPIFALPVLLLALGACDGPSGAPPEATAATVAPIAFEVPMDPGQIRCAQLSNPSAMAEATNWAIGQARAAVMAGRSSAQPDAATISASLTRYCSANPDSTLHSAVDQMGT